MTRSVSTEVFHSLLVSVITRLLTIGRLGVLGALINFPFESVGPDHISRIVNLFLFVEETEGSDGTAEPFSMRKVEARLADMNKVDLIHYIKAVSGFVRKIQFKRADRDPERMVAEISPLIAVLYRVSFVLSATRHDVVSIRHDVFAMLVDHHPPLLTLILKLISNSMDEIGDGAISFIQYLPCSRWIPEQTDLALIQGMSHPYLKVIPSDLDLTRQRSIF